MVNLLDELREDINQLKAEIEYLTWHEPGSPRLETLSIDLWDAESALYELEAGNLYGA